MPSRTTRPTSPAPTGVSRRAVLAAGAALLGGAATASSGAQSRSEDLADARRRGEWLHHPVIGDPSWDSFAREPGNPVHVGRDPYAWPVNGFLFRDPPTGRWYAYVSVYPRGYWGEPPANCLLLREGAPGRWEDCGLLFTDEAPAYAREEGRRGLMTDASVVFHGGRYHLLFGWANRANTRGGLGYAWAARPEGPFHPAPDPVHDDARQAPIRGRYVRAYASTLFRRRRDWLILHMMSTPGNVGGIWALCAMTAPEAGGPYGAPELLLYPQSERFHPALAEFYPAFAHGGRVYAPATSVAMNRTYQTIFTAGLEGAHRPDAWRVSRLGSAWHAEPAPSEAFGLWGQTFSGQVGPDGALRALFPSKDRSDRGTIGLARRPLARPYRRGFVLSAPRAPALAVLRRSYRSLRCRIAARSTGPWALCWGCRGPLGPNHHMADSAPHPLSLADRIEWRRAGDRWEGVEVDAAGLMRTLGSGTLPVSRGTEHVVLDVGEDGAAVRVGDSEVWRAPIPAREGRVELLAQAGTILRVERMDLAGPARGGWETWLASEGLAGAGAPARQWREARGGGFRLGVGRETDVVGARAKWSFVGCGYSLHAPRGPRYGRCRVLVDGVEVAVVDLRAPAEEPSRSIAEGTLPAGLHAVALEVVSGTVPCDCLEVLAAPVDGL
ncbi:MAG: hypothetical protein IT208_07300 [Chthonomonadales bacterium]|nr:hypothetical protein [Chthonomonadales bacterium]